MTGRHPFEYEDTQTVTILGKQLSTPLKIPGKSTCHGGSPDPESLPSQKPGNASEKRTEAEKSAETASSSAAPAPCPDHPLALKLLFLLGTSAAVWLLLWLLLPFSRMRSTLDGNLAGYNSLGMRIWQQDTRHRNGRSPSTTRPIAKVTRHSGSSWAERRAIHVSDRPHPSGRFPPALAQTRHPGRITSETNLVHIDHMDYFDFFPMAMIESQDQIDWDDDGDDEVFLTIRQAESMFPACTPSGTTETIPFSLSTAREPPASKHCWTPFVFTKRIPAKTSAPSSSPTLSVTITSGAGTSAN
jgi:hypothetical protein